MNQEQVRIFLLEFFVEKIQLVGVKSDAGGQICVRFQFLSYPVLDVCEEDFVPKHNKESNEVNFNSGKSVLFSLRGPNAASFRLPFDVYVTVTKKRGCGGSGQEIGTAVVQLGGSFTELVNRTGALGESLANSSKSKTLKKEYSLKDGKGNETGRIMAFVRLSCFGNTIVTQFQVGGLENSSFLFKGEDINDGSIFGSQNSLKQIKEVSNRGGAITQSDMKAPGFGTSGNNLNQFPGYGQGGPMYGEMVGGWSGGGMDQWMGGPMPMQQQGWGGQGMCGGQGMFGGPAHQPHPCFCPPCGGSEDSPSETEEREKGNYKDISVEVNGHSMNIRIPRKQKQPKSNTNYPFCEKVKDNEGENWEDGVYFCMKGPKKCPMGYGKPPTTTTFPTHSN